MRDFFENDIEVGLECGAVVNGKLVWAEVTELLDENHAQVVYYGKNYIVVHRHNIVIDQGVGA